MIQRVIIKFRKLFLKSVYVFGDSHVEIFIHMNKIFFHNIKKFEVTLVGGATAQGMRNPNSKTNALEIFRNNINRIKNKKSKLFFQLGEVDTGFVIWYRAKKFNESVEIQMSNSVIAYVEFLKEIQHKGFKNIFVISAPLPTIDDGQIWGEVANARKEITATKKERTDLTLKYNKILEQEMNKINVSFISLDNELLDKNTRLIKDEFKNKDVNNHHLDIDKYAKITFNKIKKII